MSICTMMKQYELHCENNSDNICQRPDYSFSSKDTENAFSPVKIFIA